jgi:hypothetical protein
VFDDNLSAQSTRDTHAKFQHEQQRQEAAMSWLLGIAFSSNFAISYSVSAARIAG